MAKKYRIGNINTYALESSASLVFLFKQDLVLSSMIQYKSPVAKIQTDYFEDVLYYNSLDKSFSEHIRIGITSAIPFKKQFPYQGYNSVIRYLKNI